MAAMEGHATAEARSGGHLERFNLDQQGGRLIDAEHRGRYWWAAQIAAGKDVLDVACGTGYGTSILRSAGAASVTAADVDPSAVAAAAGRLGDGATVLRADLRELPLEDDSFDLVVCWETIEHVEEGERAIAELRRVLRPDGLLLISSPNPAVYPPGNEHHVHEYSADELVRMVGERFSNLAVHRQHAWLAAVIESAEGMVRSASASEEPIPCPTRAIDALREGEETYALIAASDAELPSLEDLVTLGDGFEVRWWEEQLTSTRRLLAQVEAREAELTGRLRETSAALLDANQSLAQIPLLAHQRDLLAHQREVACTAIKNVEDSISWRITAPLRRLRGRRS
jgi:2-polyprenyl-3-methyl-5-hydroxy-6-metoxy-1,4-benzoquinol methylase